MAMYTVLVGLIYGILEGLTEWLPVSSTGHLILLRQVLPPVDNAFFALFEVVIQLGAMAAVPVLFFDRLWPLCRKDKGEMPPDGARKRTFGLRREVLALWGRILLAALPAAAIGFLLDDWLESHLFRVPVVGAMLILYGLLFLLPLGKRPGTVQDLADLTPRQAAGVGAFQVLSLVPGTSRSGATILGGLAVGLDRPTAATFSFFLGVPVMAGAGALRTLRYFAGGGQLCGEQWLLLVTGTATAFSVSLLVLRTLVAFVRRHSFAPFGVYRILLGAAVLALYGSQK